MATSSILGGERATENPRVGGSIPPQATIQMNGLQGATRL